MRLLFLSALLMTPCISYGFIDKIVALANMPARRICRMLGDVHTHDRHNHRATIKAAVKKRVTQVQQLENPTPLTIYVEDPTELPGIEKLIPKVGVLPGLVKELNELELPKHIVVTNFDQRKYSSCVSKWFNPCAVPHALSDAPYLKEYTFGHVVDEMQKGIIQTETRVKEYTARAPSNWIKEDLVRIVSHIKTNYETFKNRLHETHISLSDSILHTGIQLFADDVVSITEYIPYAKGKTKQEIVALLEEGTPSDQQIQRIAEIPRFHNPASKSSLIEKPLYDASVALASTDAFFSIIGTKGNSALIAGATHTDDVSGWMINTEDWGDHPADASFSDNWLTNASLQELEAEYLREP